MIRPGIFQPADGMAFHVLGEQGVLFSEPRQELHLLDAAASYVWCSIRESTPVGEIVSRYADACAMALPDAEQTVHVLLNRWLGLGYIRGDSIPTAVPVALTTALGRLLINHDLRAAFAADPHATARSLGLDDRHIPLLSAIDPADLDEAAALAEPSRDDDSTRTAMPDPVVVSAIGRYRTREWSAPTAARHYRLGGSALRIAFDTPDQETRIHSAFRHLETGPAAPDFAFDIIAERQGHVLLRDGKPVAFCNGLDHLARTALVAIRDAVIEHADYFMLIHAGLVSNGDACAMLPAAPGSGKSTLAAALARAGFRFFTDEIAMLDAGTMAARPFPFPVVVKQGSMAPLQRWYPDLADLPLALRDNDQPVRYMPLDPSGLPVESDCRQPVRWIVFPRYAAAAGTALHPIHAEDALARLLQECRIVRTRLDESNVAGLIEWLRTVSCYDLPLSSLPDAVALMQALCAVPGDA